MDDFFPQILITYLCHFRQAFSSPGFRYFQGFIVSLLLVEGRHTVTRLASACFFIDKSLASWERFLSEAQWDMAKVTQGLIRLILGELGHSLLFASRYLLAIDPTYVPKVMGKMAGVQRWTEGSPPSSQRVSLTGHYWSIAGFLMRIGTSWHCLPVLSRLISGQTSPSHFTVDSSGHAHPMTFWEVVLAMVFQIAACVTSAPLCVVADAYFAKAIFFNGLAESSIGLVTRLRHDAVGWDDPVYGGRGRPPKRGKKWKLRALWGNVPHEVITATIYGKTVALAVVVRDIWLRDVKQKVKVVVLGTHSRPILLASSVLNLTAQEIVEIYAARFALETLIRDLKQHIGFGTYQAITTIAFQRFTQLCCCAATIGRLMLIKSKTQPWLSQESTTVHETDGSLRRLRRCLRQFVLKHLLFEKSAPDADVEKSPKEIEAILRLAA